MKLWPLTTRRRYLESLLRIRKRRAAIRKRRLHSLHSWMLAADRAASRSAQYAATRNEILAASRKAKLIGRRARKAEESQR